MSIDALKNLIPDYAKDIKLNLSSLAGEEILTTQQLWGTFLVSALASGNATVTALVHEAAAPHLSAEALNAVKAANAIMAMNNIYYKFSGTMEAYKTLPAKLRMNVIANPGVEKTDFELWSLAVSAINGCQYCVNAHEQTLIGHGISQPQVQAAVRIAAVVHATASVLSGEDALNGGALAQAA